MASTELREDEEISGAMVRRLTREAVRLNEALGNPYRCLAIHDSNP